MRFFTANDIILVPLCILLLYIILRSRANANKDPWLRKLYYRAFYFKIACVFAFALITEFYFGGGDTGLYYQAIQDLRQALSQDSDYFPMILTTANLDAGHPLSPFFLYDNSFFGFTYGYMVSPANFLVPRLGLLPAIVFFDSYLCISLCFSFFALGGMIRLFKTFHHFYPIARKELALAIMFLPSVGFWSGGLLKDTVCLGCVGFLVYAVFNIFVRKKQFLFSGFWIVVSGYILLVIKAYIFLVLILALSVWVFSETNKLIKNQALRQAFAFLTLAIGLAVGFFMVEYFTSESTLRQYQIENIAAVAEYQRRNYEIIDQVMEGTSSYYSINVSNPFLLVVNSLGAVFFRPFLWEVNSMAAVLSSIEALAFLLLTLNLIFKGGPFKSVKTIFKDPRLLMSFVFAIVFAVGVGASTANFGALSRYKIPSMPFYMIVLLITHRKMSIPLPGWLRLIMGKNK